MDLASGFQVGCHGIVISSAAASSPHHSVTVSAGSIPITRGNSTQARRDYRWCAACRSAQGITTSEIFAWASQRSRSLHIKAVSRFRCRRSGMCRSRVLTPRPPPASSARPEDRGLCHRLAGSRFQFHPTPQPPRPEAGAQGLAPFLPSITRSRRSNSLASRAFT